MLLFFNCVILISSRPIQRESQYIMVNLLCIFGACSHVVSAVVATTYAARKEIHAANVQIVAV